MERITTDMIAEKEFGIESRGYSKDEVDTFLDLICEEMDRLNNEIQDLRQKTTIVRSSAPAPESSGVSREDESKFREILEMAATVKEETIRKAREDAEAIRLKAETEANERLNGLAEEREGLEKEVAALKEAAADYRRKFEELLNAQQEALEKATGLF
ncbi:MAG: DivIVA domain-containing protein [Clostridia bacterium]|nr:DivIVA domain-containing protein [Clostridia bacterium]